MNDDDDLYLEDYATGRAKQIASRARLVAKARPAETRRVDAAMAGKPAKAARVRNRSPANKASPAATEERRPQGDLSEIDVAIQAWIDNPPGVSEGTALTYRRQLKAFASYAANRGLRSLDEITDAVVAEFERASVISGSTASAPAAATRRTRRAAIGRLLASSDGTAAVQPSSDEPRDDSLHTRATRELTPEELDSILVSLGGDSRDDSGRVVAVLMGEAGATISEAAELRLSDYDATAGELQLPGDERILPRRVSLSTVGQQILEERRLRVSQGLRRGEDPFLVSRSDDPLSRAGNISQVTTRVLGKVGLAGVTGLAPMSLRATAGRRVFEATGSLGAAAVFLGYTSLDVTARAIGYDWQSAEGATHRSEALPVAANTQSAWTLDRDTRATRVLYNEQLYTAIRPEDLPRQSGPERPHDPHVFVITHGLIHALGSAAAALRELNDPATWRIIEENTSKYLGARARARLPVAPPSRATMYRWLEQHRGLLPDIEF